MKPLDRYLDIAMLVACGFVAVGLLLEGDWTAAVGWVVAAAYLGLFIQERRHSARLFREWQRAVERLEGTRR